MAGIKDLNIPRKSNVLGELEFTGDNQIVNGREQPFTDNRVLVEFGYTLNQNLPQGVSGYSCALPMCLPGSNYLSNAQQIQVNNGSYTATPSGGFNFRGNNNYIIYGFLNEVDCSFSNCKTAFSITSALAP